MATIIPIAIGIVVSLTSAFTNLLSRDKPQSTQRRKHKDHGDSFVYSKINKLTKIVFKQFVNSSQQMVFVA